MWVAIQVIVGACWRREREEASEMVDLLPTPMAFAEVDRMSKEQRKPRAQVGIGSEAAPGQS